PRRMPLRVDNCRGTFSRPDTRAARFLFLSMPAVLAGGLLEFKETLKSNLTFHIWSEATSRCCLRNFDGFNLPPLLRILA
ncbi:MAG: hypothetical protein ACLQDI_09200, partial [Syntrophobacteraceae bacterium]